MQYLNEKYIVKGLFRGDLKRIRALALNPVNNEPYSYAFIRKVLQGERNNSLILNTAKQLILEREKQRILKLSA